MAYLMCLITASRGTAENEHVDLAKSFRTEHGTLRYVGLRHPVITNLSCHCLKFLTARQTM